MSLDIGEVLQEGFDRTLEKNGLMFAGLFYVTSLLSAVASDTLMKGMEFSTMYQGQMQQATYPLAAGSAALGGVLALVGSLVSALIGVAALRTFTSSETETIPTEYFTDNILFVLGNLIVGGIAFAVMVGFGFLLLVIPGLFLLVSLYFWNVIVIVERSNFIDAMQESWNMTSGNRLKLFLLGAVVLIGTGIFTSILSMPINLVLGPSPVASILALIPGALTAVFSSATTASAYKQLKED
ncbi:MAG: hypothetical protein ABEK01_04695 [Candidatus Nanohaloarchaea archaeon]